jgi:hypothetical protein
VETLADAHPGKVQYNAFCNEWNICMDWLNKSYEELDEEVEEENADELHQGRAEGGINSLAGASSGPTIVQTPTLSSIPSVMLVAVSATPSMLTHTARSLMPANDLVSLASELERS